MSDAITGQSVLANLFRQNRWANLATIEACTGMEPALLDAEAPGTVGTIRDTLWHVAEVENHFLAALNGHPNAASLAPLEGSGGDLVTLRRHAERIGDALVAWAEAVANDEMLTGIWGDGPYRVPASMFAAQAIFHGTTHHWQIGEALELFGVEAPDTGGWAWWESGAAAREGVGRE
jgi:uncharacterized damage-inducible protein DinB